MRLSLTDLLMACGFMAFAAVFVAPSLLPHHPLVALVAAVIVYYAAIAPFVYRMFGLPPMLLPRCPCCGQWGEGFHVLAHWPRVTYRCAPCEGEFAVWHGGKVGRDETWESPVLVLKWPYVFGPYRSVEKPGQAP